MQAGQGNPEPSPHDRRLFNMKVRHVGDRVAGIVALVLAAHSIRILKTEVQFAGRLRNIFRRRGTKEGHS